MVLRARPNAGAVTLALLFGLLNLLCGTWTLAAGIELRGTGKTLPRSARSSGADRLLRQGRQVSSPAQVLRSADGNLSPAGTRC